LIRAGGNGYPLELLRRAGVDLTTPQPVSEALDEFQRMVAQFEQLTAR
jgi:oligoendopeptidase F